ncbi:hypothetical protein LCE31_06860 [Streptomyces sp. 8L]|nr:hypothetical protein [Streptomyces sp. 8L]
MALFDGQVQLGGEPAARASQSVISGLSIDTARCFLLQVTLPSGAGRVRGDHKEQASMIRRRIIRRNRDADNRRLRAVVDRANVA